MGQKLQLSEKFIESGKSRSVARAQATPQRNRSRVSRDGNHNSTSMCLHYGATLTQFAPELAFVETSTQSFRPMSQMLEQNRFSNSLYDQAAIAAAGAGEIPVDDSEKSKRRPWNAQTAKERLSLITHERIAGRIVDHLEVFYQQHQRLPRFTVTFGSAHFRARNDLNECVSRELKMRGLPVPRSRSIEFRLSATEASKLHANWFKDYNYTLEVNPTLPKGLPDLRNPSMWRN